MLVAVLKCLVHCCWTVCFLLMISGPVYRRLDLLYVSRLLRLIKVPLCLTHPITPFLFPAAAVLSLFSFFECLVKLQNPDVKPPFSTSSLSLFLRSLCLCSALCFISLVCLFCFCNSQLSVLFMFLCAEMWAHKQGHHVCVYKHVVCTYTHQLMAAGALPSCSFCVFIWPQRNHTIQGPPWISLVWCNYLHLGTHLTTIKSVVNSCIFLGLDLF